VGFKGLFFDKLLAENVISAERLVFDVGLSEYIITIFTRILDEVRSQRPLYQFKACAGVMELLAEMHAWERRREQTSHAATIVEKAKHLMEANVYGKINLSAISEQLGVNSSRFFEIFKTYTSMTPYQYYIHIKIHQAETLLEHRDLPVKDVALRMGFEDPYYFSRLFKNKTGYSPTEWRKMIVQ
jgi:AraC-like DNA-binding protein